jgi:hypothetical protein
MLLKSIRVYDADEREKQRILRHINQLRERKPGLRITGWGLLKFFLYLLGVSAVFAVVAWALVTLAFSMVG